jgi:hypothetical protein
MRTTVSSGLNRGTVLILGLIIGAMVLFTLAAATTTTLNLGKEAKHKLDRTRALALADGVTEAAQKEMLELVASFEPVPASGTISAAGAEYPYTTTELSAPLSRTDPDGVRRTVQYFRVSAAVNLGDGYATVDRVVDLSQTPVFQYMIFFSDDLEILPGPSMTLGGRVHANGDIYVGCGNTLTVSTEHFRSTGSIYRERKNDGTTTGGTVSIQVAGEAAYVAMTPDTDSSHPEWTTYALDTWKGTVQDGSHGVTEVAAPSIGSIKAFNEDGSKGYYHKNAGLVVVNGQARDASGNLVALPPGTITERTLYDAREGKVVTITDINLGLLNGSGRFPANGLLYAYRTGASPSQPNGIRLTNGSTLAGGLTVVSEDPVYVRGDFNTVNKKGAAVIADAVNLLSNAWNDTKTAGSLPAASNTTYNLAFVTGNVPTPDGGGPYSGGFENLPRFHENWTNRRATIRGSFINMYESEIAKGQWRYGGDVYTAPIRDWAFDPDLVSPGGLPPFTPNLVHFVRVLWDDRLELPFGEG